MLLCPPKCINTRSDLLPISCITVLYFRLCKDRQAFVVKFSCHMMKLKGLNESMDHLMKQCKARSHIMIFQLCFVCSATSTLFNKQNSSVNGLDFRAWYFSSLLCSHWMWSTTRFIEADHSPLFNTKV